MAPKRNLLKDEAEELSELDIRVLSCSKLPPERWREAGNRLGDVRVCAGFSPEITYKEIVPGGLCQTDEEGVERLCKGIGEFLPKAESEYALIDRSAYGGYGVSISDKTAPENRREVLIKKISGKWRPVLYSPTGKMEDAVPVENIETELGDGFKEFVEYANNQREGVDKKYPEDDFGLSIEKLDELELVKATNCHGGDTCAKLTPKGFNVYYAFHRGKVNDGIHGPLKDISRQGGVSMEFESHLTGLEKTGATSRKIWLQKESEYVGNESRIKALGKARKMMAQKAGVSPDEFNVESTGRLELKNIEPWKGRSIKGMIDEIAKYEKIFAEMGYTRPEASVMPTDQGTKISGGIHLTFSPPITRFDTERKDLWETFLLNFTRLTQWWEPLLIGVTGSPVKNTRGDDPEWFYSIRHQSSSTVKAGAARIEDAVDEDGAIGIVGGGSIPWFEESLKTKGKVVPEGMGRADLRIRSNSVIWSRADVRDCYRAFADEPVFSDQGSCVGDYRHRICKKHQFCDDTTGRCTDKICQNLSDQAVELRFFEYEPLELLEERAEVMPLLMDRAYQLAAQDIEVPSARSDRHFNNLMWKVMTKGWKARISSGEGKKYAKLFTGESEGDNLYALKSVENLGREIVDHLWEDHYDDYFTRYFKVEDKPAHLNYLKKSKKLMEEWFEEGELYTQVTDERYGEGGRVS